MNFREGGPRKRRGALATALDMTPLIDVVFLLLIFFFITSTFITRQTNPKLDVTLPKSASSTQTTVQGNLAIVIHQDGTVKVDGRVVTFDGLEERLRTFQEKHPKNSVILQADEAVPHGKVIKVMGIVDKLGLRISVGVQEK